MSFLLGGNVPRWDIANIPSQVGKVAIVTGSNSGIGFYTARALAERGAHVVLACRNETSGREAETAIAKYLAANQTSNAGSVEFRHIDLSVLQSVRDFAEGIKSRFTALDLLINNAGIAAPTEVLTSDGTESSLPRYGRSKLTNCMFTLELATRLEQAGISNIQAVVAHPGMTYTSMVNKIIESMLPRMLSFLSPPLEYIATWLPFQETEMGALPTLYAATDKGVANGDYVGPADYGHRRGYPMKQRPRSNTQSHEDRLQLWQLSESLAQIRFEVA